jgi:hypothetical protein
LALDPLGLTLDALRTLAFDPLGLTLHALRTLAFDPLGLTLHARRALHSLGTLLRAFGSLRPRAVAAVALRASRRGNRHRGNAGGKYHPGKHTLSPFERQQRPDGRTVPHVVG